MPSASSEFADLAAALGLGGVSGAIPAVLAVITHTPIVAACPPFVLDYFIAGDPETLAGLQISALKFQSLNSNSRELELTNLLGLVLGCIEAKFCK